MGFIKIYFCKTTPTSDKVFDKQKTLGERSISIKQTKLQFQIPRDIPSVKTSQQPPFTTTSSSILTPIPSSCT